MQFKAIGFFIAVLFIFAGGVLADEPTEPADLWLDMSMGPPLVPLFNNFATENDIARIEDVRALPLLDAVTVGRKLVVFRSAEQAADEVPDIADQFDILGYNLERANPNVAEEDKDDPLAAVERMRELADEHDLLLAMGPDNSFAVSHGIELAPYVDLFILQIQRRQTEPAVVRNFIAPLIPELREANPDIEISVQIRTEGEADELVAIFEPYTDMLDGISILTSPTTVPTAQALLRALRPAPTLTSPPRTDGTGTLVVPPIPTPEPVSLPRIPPTSNGHIPIDDTGILPRPTELPPLPPNIEFASTAPIIIYDKFHFTSALLEA